MDYLRELLRCNTEILLASYALITGRDALDGGSVSIEQAMLYLTDWEIERALILQEADPSNPLDRPRLPVLDSNFHSGSVDLPKTQC